MGTELKGIAASEGLFMGPVLRLVGPRKARIATGDPHAEREALAQAIAAAVDDLASLQAGVEGEAQDMLGFQIAMLEDEALAGPALAAIGGGASADAAWEQALESEIAGYEASDDDYFRARAADLKDMRDRVLRHLAGDPQQASHGASVLVGEDIAPTQFLETDWSHGGAIALIAGSPASHVAMLARTRGVPMVVGLAADRIISAKTLIVDGDKGSVICDPSGAEIACFASRASSQREMAALDEQFRLKPALRRDGSRIELLVNAASVEELAHIDGRSCDGIGLMRSEFLFRDGALLPDEEQQYCAYRRFLEWAEGRPVTIRTLDIGGDKPIHGLTSEGESNPFLGLRGVRLTLAHEEVFRTQLKALLRAAAHGPLKVMIPMVTVPEELSRTATLLDACRVELEATGVPCARPPLGIMVEVPAAAIAPDLFGEAAFFSIGSNDLTQYVTASSRDDGRVAALNDCGHPAVTRLIASVAAFGRDNGIPVSLCGDMASDTRHLKALLDAGLTSLSVSPSRIGRIKAALAEL